MTIQQLVVFLAVCEKLNYTRAAAKVFMSRQAVRQNIAELEKEFDGFLFENRSNRLALTAKGELLQRKALPVLKSFRELQTAMIADIKPDHPLRLGISISLIPDYLPGLLDHISDFGQRYPNLVPEILRLENDELGPALSSGIIDAAVVMDLGGCFPGLERTVLSAHPASAMVSSRHALFTRQQIHMSDLNGEKMYLPGLGPEFSPLFTAAEKAGSEIDFTVMLSYYQVLFHVQDHGGAALNRYLPGDDTDPSRVRSIPLTDVPHLCSSFLIRGGTASAPLLLLREWLTQRIQQDFLSRAGTKGDQRRHNI